MKLIKLNKTQEEQLIKLLSYYSYCYICNTCGSVYGTDFLDKNKECPTCETIREHKEKEKKK